jgi:hypothetical protein
MLLAKVRASRRETNHEGLDRYRSALESVGAHASFKEGRGYGSPRVQDDMVEWNEHVSRKLVIRLMQEDA